MRKRSGVTVSPRATARIPSCSISHRCSVSPDGGFCLFDGSKRISLDALGPVVCVSCIVLVSFLLSVSVQRAASKIPEAVKPDPGTARRNRFGGEAILDHGGNLLLGPAWIRSE